MIKIRPRDLTEIDFSKCPFRPPQVAEFMRTIIAVQYRVDPDHWTPFSWADYDSWCDHDTDYVELDILNAMTNGGTVELGTYSIYFCSGFFSKIDNRYHVEQQLLDVFASMGIEAS